MLLCIWGDLMVYLRALFACPAPLGAGMHPWPGLVVVVLLLLFKPAAVAFVLCEKPSKLTAPSPSKLCVWVSSIICPLVAC